MNQTRIPHKPARRAHSSTKSPASAHSPQKPAWVLYPHRHPVLLTLLAAILLALMFFVVKPYVSYRIAEAHAKQLLTSISLSGTPLYNMAEDIGCASHDVGWFGRTTDCGFVVGKAVTIKGDKKALSNTLRELDSKLRGEMGYVWYTGSNSSHYFESFLDGDGNVMSYIATPNTDPRLNVSILKLPTTPYEYRRITGIYDKPMPNLDGYDYVVLVEGVVGY